MRMMNPLGRASAIAALALLGTPICAGAGSFVTDFNSGLPPGSAVFGSSAVSPNNGSGGGSTNSGCLQLSGGLGGQGGAFIITNDLDGGVAVASFAAAFEVLMAGGDAAAGFSFNFAPDLPRAPIPMAGAGSGLTVEFDTLIEGATEPAPAIAVRVAGQVCASAYDEGLQAGGFVGALIQLNPNNTLDVVYDGVYVCSNLNLSAFGYSPAPGSLFGFGSITTGETNAEHFIDNLSIVTATTAGPYVQSFAPRGRQAPTNAAIDIVLENDLTAVAPGSVVLTLDGAAVSPVLTTNGGETRVHFAPPSGLAFASTHAVGLAFADNAAPAARHFNWNYGFTVANPPFVPGTYATVFSEGFESYALGTLDKNPLYYLPGNGPNYAPNGSGNPWFGPTPPNAQVVGTVNGVAPHSGAQMLSGASPGDEDQDWCNLAYRAGGGRSFTGNCALDWWFFDPVGDAANAVDFQDYVALCSYSTAPTNTDYPESATPEDNGNLNAGLAVSAQYQRLSLGGSGFMPDYGAYNSSKYQARIAGAALGYGQGWIDTACERAVGWHHGRILLGAPLADGTTTVYFYIDDLVTPVYSGNSLNRSGFNVIEINSAQANAVGFFDDVSFSVVTTATTPSKLSVALAGKMVVLTWQGGVLQSAPALSGPWSVVSGAASPYSYNPASGPMRFFRLEAAASQPSLSVARAGKMVVLSWQGSWTLQSAASLSGPWADVSGAASPYSWDPASAPRQFFRLRD